jgi:cellulose synthase/poly-beta-1,6-N-acetylglucosamine synthase-like glycosyltransferase
MMPCCIAHIDVSAAAQTGFWIAVTALVYVYVGYPALLASVAPFCKRRRGTPGYYPSMSIIIAAYNEAGHIGCKIAETLALDYPADKLEILVVSDHSADGTDAIVSGCPNTRVRLIRNAERKGKTYAQNEGVKQARGEIVVFSDATTVYDRQALMYLACNYEDPEVGAVSGLYRYIDPHGKSPTELGSITFWNYENMIKRLQSRIRTLTGCSGCIYSLRRSIYTPLSETACSDLVEPLQVIKHGYRVAFEDRAIAYEEPTRSARDEFRMRVRVATHGISGVLALAELLKVWRYGWISFQLISHKLLRWLVPVFLIVLLASSALLSTRRGYGYVFYAQVLFYLYGLASLLIPVHRHWKPLGLPLYFCTLNLATLVSFVKFFRGQRYAVWETVRR